MNWAIIRTGGKQYKVAEGDTIDIEKLDSEKDAKITFDEVLAIGGEKIEVGAPLVEKAKVSAIVIENFKGPKIRVVKFKPKAKYLRTKGHRHQLTRVKIEKINI